MKTPQVVLRGRAAVAASVVLLFLTGPVIAEETAHSIAEKFAVAAEDSQNTTEDKRQKTDEVEMLDRARQEAEARAIQQRKLEEWRAKLGPKIEGDEQAKAAAAAQRKREAEQKAAAGKAKTDEDKRSKDAADAQRRLEDDRKAAEFKAEADRKAAAAKADDERRTREAADAQRKRDDERKAAETREAEDRRLKDTADADRRREQERKAAAEKANDDRRAAQAKAEQEARTREASEAQRRLDDERRAADAKAEDNRRAGEAAEAKRRQEDEREAEARRLAERLNRANETRDRAAADRARPPVEPHMGQPSMGLGRSRPDLFPNDTPSDTDDNNGYPDVVGPNGTPSIADDKSLKDDWKSDDGARPFGHRNATPSDTRYTVLLVMEPGHRGIRRFNKKADPVICFGDQCFVSTGPSTIATAMPMRRALSGANTFGKRAGACRNMLKCVFRGVDLAQLPAVIQPVDLKILIHDRREPTKVEPDMGCRAKTGRVWCAHTIVTRTYRAWIIPEHLAAKAGPGGLAAALAGGLTPRGAREAALRE